MRKYASAPKLLLRKCRNSVEQVVAVTPAGAVSHVPPLPGPVGVNTISVELLSRLYQL
jgi:hypothetical protein